MLLLSVGLVIGLVIGWQFPQPVWVANAWASFKSKYL